MNSDTTRTARAGGARVPLRRRIPADLDTPVSAYLKLAPLGAAFLLESVEGGIQVGRHSFIGVGPFTTITLRGDAVTKVDPAGAAHTEPVDPADIFAPVRRVLAAQGLAPDAELPGPFGGAVGHVAYDCVRRFEPVPLPAERVLELPDYHFVVPTTLAVFDHVKSEVELLVLPNGDAAAAAHRLDELLAALRAPLPDLPPPPGRSDVAPAATLDREAFAGLVRRAKEHILDGDCFQIVLSQALRGTTAVAPFRIYRALRILNPSPYLFFLDHGDHQVIGSSPEVLVKLEGERVSLCPIAGTRPRGATPVEDRRLEQELLADEKERAEHVMLVDLGRNDVGRVCRTDTVETEAFMTVERYSHVMHIVSRVAGDLRPGLDQFGLLEAAFPAGTVSGAPKIRAMQVISELEGRRRGPYAGAVGYFGANGDMDMCIAIRTLFMQDGRYHAQAGAGIVADSDPYREYQETLDKLGALIRAVEIAEEGA
jgi:anthranilate synthase component 1